MLWGENTSHMCIVHLSEFIVNLNDSFFSFWSLKLFFPLLSSSITELIVDCFLFINYGRN
jgi:hypothetical protein